MSVFNGLVQSIGEGAFYNCNSLTSVIIGNGVTSIGESAFYNSFRITSITYNGTKAKWEIISKGNDWAPNSGVEIIHCSDGDVTL